MSRDKPFLPSKSPPFPPYNTFPLPKNNSSSDITSVLFYIVSSFKCVSLKCMALFYLLFLGGEGVGVGFYSLFQLMHFIPISFFSLLIYLLKKPAYFSISISILISFNMFPLPCVSCAW